MSQHARFAPSDAHIWGNCSGSIRARAGRPNPETEEARIGTAAHWVFDKRLAGEEVNVGDKAPNGVVIDADISEGAQVVVDDVRDVMARFPGGKLYVEHHVAMPDIHAENDGTPDLFYLTACRQWLFLWDYKHGHRDVPARNNLQCVDYLRGAANELGIDGNDEQRITCIVRIVQPYSYSSSGPIKEWVVRLSDLRAQWNHLRSQAEEADAGGTLTTGLWCRDCTARVDCAARRRADYNLIDLARQPFEMDAMSAHDLAVEWRILSDGLKAAEKRLEAIQDELEQRIRAGATDTGLKLQQGTGRLTWSCEPTLAVSLARQFGVDISKPGVLTPGQAVKAAPLAVRPMLEQVLTQYTHRPAGSIKLVPADESRTARAFKKEQ